MSGDGIERLIEALAWHDNESRAKRAERIAWASGLYQAPGVVMGRIVPLALMEEARICFVNGQFMATILSATSVVEHLLVDELETRGVSGKKGTFRDAIECARKAKAFPITTPMLDDADQLRQRRNPLVHRNADEGEHSLGERYLKRQVHPRTVLEGDARFALTLMYDFFRSVLRAG
jgi:hypothetical protein